MPRPHLPLILVLLLSVGDSVASSHVRVTDASDTGLTVRLRTTGGPPDLNAPHVRGATGHALPMVVELLACPPGADIEIDVNVLSTRTMDGIDLPLADEGASDHPGVVARTVRLGVLAGVDAYALQVFPVGDDAAGQLILYEDLSLRIRFTGSGSRFTVAAESGGTPVSPLHRAFLNPPRRNPERAAPSAARQAGSWYDPALNWVKVYVEEDGLYRVTAARLRFFGIDPEGVDPTRLRLLHLGVEQPLHVSGAEDGRFDEEDEILFVGRYRRAPDPAIAGGERDHESEYGARETYWLTWQSDQPGLRFETVDGTPDRGLPVRSWYLHRKHVEQDRAFAVLEEAPDDLSDRWFWQNDRPLKASSPDTRATQAIIANLSGLPESVEDYEARLRVAVTGETPAVVGEHHAFITLNGQQLAEAVWSGQTEYVFDEPIPSSLLKDRNELLFQAQADRSRFDWIWFNWYELTYRRQFHAYPGKLSFATDVETDGHRITVEGFRHADIRLFDTASGRRLTGGVVVADDSLFSLRFEDTPQVPPAYVIADSLSILQPVLDLDTPSDLRRDGDGAQAVIVTHPDYLSAAQRLAEHRRQVDGLSVRVVSIQDIFDEYRHGRFTREALADFLADIYQRWTPRPVFVLLLGDATWDYRGIRTGRREQALVPTLYYNARDRGYSPSDHLLSLVDGDDQLPDLVIGRLPVDTPEEADRVVDKIITYDLTPAAGDWRGRAILAANWHDADEFIIPNENIANRHLDPVGIRARRFYAPDEEDLPNVTGKGFLDALNEGALLVNFAGHGGVGSMHFLLSAEFPDWDYMSQIHNGRRLPLITALSCLNGRFTEPTAEGLSERFIEHPDGGAIAYVSATAVSLTAQNELLSDFLYDALIGDDPLSFGAALAWAKARVISVRPSFIDVPLTMQLFGDPMQRLALQPAPDYAATDLRLPSTPLLRAQPQSVEVTLSNGARLGTDSIRVQVVAILESVTDTLLDEVTPPFVGDTSRILTWQPQAAGDYTLAVELDTEDAVVEVDESNNRQVVHVEVLIPRLARPLWPAPDAASADLQLEAAVSPPFGDPSDVVEFALSSATTFPDSATSLMAATASSGMAQAQAVAPPGARPGDLLYWRSRLIDGQQMSPWSPTRALRWDDISATADTILWSQTPARQLQSDSRGLKLRQGRVTAAAVSPPFRPGSSTRDISFTVLGLGGAGVLATDGTYLYVKRWFNDPSTIYGGTDLFARIGTGFNGTIKGGDYGVLPNTTTAGICAAWHEGYIYSDAGMSHALERTDPVSGHLDTVAVPDGLLDWLTGRVVENAGRGQVLHALFTSDGHYLYNVSMSSHLGIRVGWGVRVFETDTDGDWRLLREFVIPPTETGFTYRWTDGVIADGERLYLIEYGGERRIRMVDAVDGTLLDEWRSDQDTTRVITGQYDPAHDRVWLGDLNGPGLFGYRRDGEVVAGELLGDAIGPAAAWQQIQADGEGALVQVEGRGSDGSWSELNAGETPLQLDLSQVDAARYRYLRLRSQVGPDTTQSLADWTVSYQAVADLAVLDASADVVEDQLLVRAWVQNLGLVSGAAAALSLQIDGQSLVTAAVEPLGRGRAAQITFDPLPLPERAEGLRLLLEPTAADGDGGNNALELVLTSAGFTTIRFVSEDSGQRLSTGDVLGAHTAIRVLAPPLVDGRLQLEVDGAAVTADSSWHLPDGTLALRHHLARGQRTLRAVLSRDGTTFGTGEIQLQVDDRLQLTQVLVAPHPLRGEGALTWVLSHEATVHAEIFAVSGRRVRRLAPIDANPGFGQLTWDLRDDGGHAVAAGTYVYVLTAVDRADESIIRRHRGGLVILP